MQFPPIVQPWLRRRRTARPSRRAAAAAGLVVGAVCLGLSTVATEGAMDGLPPLTIAAARFGVAAVALGAVCRARGVPVLLDRRALVLGSTGIAVPFALQNLGLLGTGAGTSVLLIRGTVPALTALVGLALLGERVGAAGRRGLLVGLAGVALAVGGGAEQGLTAAGGLLALGSGAAFAVATVLGRWVYRDGFSLAVLTGGTTVGAVLLAPLAAVEVAASGPPSPGRGDLLLVLFLGLAGSAATQLLWAVGLAHLPAAEAAQIGGLVPITGILAASALLGEPTSAAELGGAGLISAAAVVGAGRAPVLRRPRGLPHGTEGGMATYPPVDRRARAARAAARPWATTSGRPTPR